MSEMAGLRERAEAQIADVRDWPYGNPSKGSLQNVERYPAVFVSADIVLALLDVADEMTTLLGLLDDVYWPEGQSPLAWAQRIDKAHALAAKLNEVK